MELPRPSEDALAHSARLTDIIHQAIALEQGAITFARFMELALYAPGLGYYSAGARKFGAEGDFVTAPELGGGFAHALAHAGAMALAAGVDGVRADLVMLRAARASAALDGRDAVTVADVDTVAELALHHRRQAGAQQPTPPKITSAPSTPCP